MGRLGWVVAVVIVVLAASGCGRRDKQAGGRKATGASASVPLPEWAPANPSPEFLRAAKVLKPMPPEVFRDAAQADPASEAFMGRVVRTFPAAWEFFGSLTDEQIQRFFTAKPDTDDPDISKMILIPVKSLTLEQRAALDKYFDAWRTAMQGMPAEQTLDADRLVTFYRAGAKEDLSNLDVGFNQAGRSVNITFRIRRPDKDMRGFGCTIGTL